MAVIISPIPTDYTNHRNTLGMLIGRIFGDDYTDHPEAAAFARIRDALARTHRDDETRLILDQHDVATLWLTLIDRWVPGPCLVALHTLSTTLRPDLTTCEYATARMF